MRRLLSSPRFFLDSGSRSIFKLRHSRGWASTSSSSPSSADAAGGEAPSPQRYSWGSQSFYDIFPQSLPSGPPPNGPFSIDVRQLRKEFLQLQQKAHPDLHPFEMKNRAEAASAHINEAYKTLQNPLLRAQYLLSLRGVDVANDERAKVDDPELLMEVMEAREEIEMAEEEEQLSALKHANEHRIKESLRALDDAFKADELATAREEAVKLRYWINIKESIEAWERGKPVILVH